MGGQITRADSRDGSRPRRRRRRRVRCAAASKKPGSQPRSFPSRDRGPAAPRAGAPREPSRGTPWSAVAGEIRAPAAWRKRPTVLLCLDCHLASAFRPTKAVIAGARSCYASHYWQLSRCCVEYSSRAPHAAHRASSPGCALTANSSDGTREQTTRPTKLHDCTTPPTKPHSCVQREHDAQAPGPPPLSFIRTVQAGHGAQPHGPGAR